MAVTEPQLPTPLPQSSLRRARDIVVERVNEWMGSHHGHETIGHSGVVTPEFIRKQAGLAPRSIVTVIKGQASRVGGMAVQATVVFVWFVIVRGVLSDRTSDALDFAGEAVRFIYADVSRDDDPDRIFSKPPKGDSVTFGSLYKDADERTAYTIWTISWEQEITLGAAGRARPGDGVLLLINGTDVIEGDPNDDEIKFRVE